MYKGQGKPNSYLEINTSIWEKDSHGLFDYQCNKLQLKKIKIQGSCKLFRNAQSNLLLLAAQMTAVSNQDIKKCRLPTQGFSFVSSINVQRNTNQTFFSMGTPQNNSVSQLGEQANHDPYLIIRSLKDQKQIQRGYKLGDIIRLGRLEYLVLQYKDQRKMYHLRETAHIRSDLDATYVFNSKQVLSGSCKICLSQQCTQENYFVSPCKCSGSCAIVHVICLKKWIDSKIKKQPNGIATQYNFTKFQCQICKDPFPQKIIKDGVQIQMVKIQKPNRPYIIFQSLSQRKADGEKILYLITTPPENDTIKLGRGNQCQIRMSDISVSRLHAHIRFDNNRFVIYDNCSKFGTLVKQQTPMTFGYDQVGMQVGRTVITFALKYEMGNSKNKVPQKQRAITTKYS